MELLEKEEDARNYRVSFEKIKRVLDFDTTIDIPVGIEEMAHAIQNKQDLQAYGSAQYSNLQALKNVWVGKNAFEMTSI